MATAIFGFTVLPVSYVKDAIHYIYARKHQKSVSSVFPDDRTLFLVNVPPDATEREITQFFNFCGTVERVGFEDKDTQGEDEGEWSTEQEDYSEKEEERDDPPRKRRKVSKSDKKQPPKVIPLPTVPLRTIRRTGGTCHVVFLDASSMKPALSESQKPRPWPMDEEVPTGLAHYTALYDSLRPPLDIVRQHAFTAISLYQHKRESEKQKSKYRKGEAIVDDDGFTLVTRGGAYGKTLGGGVGVASKKFMKEGAQGTRSRKKKEKKEKDSFYAFQIHERNRKKTLDLQAQFQQDVEKVTKQRAERKFKPY